MALPFGQDIVDVRRIPFMIGLDVDKKLPPMSQIFNYRLPSKLIWNKYNLKVPVAKVYINNGKAPGKEIATLIRNVHRKIIK